jgi:hypothetical protein
MEGLDIGEDGSELGAAVDAFLRSLKPEETQVLESVEEAPLPILTANPSPAPAPAEEAPPVPVKATPPAPKGKPFPGISTGVLSQAFLMLIHGAPGTGKTTLVSRARRVIIADVERGSSRVDASRVAIDSFGHIQALTRWFFSVDNQQFDTLGIDTINALEKMCHEFVCAENNWPDLEKPGYGKGFAKANLEMTRFIQMIRNESLRTGRPVVFIGHSKVRSCPNPDGEDFERHCIGLHKDLTEWVYGQMDHVLFAHSKMMLKSADEKDKESKKVAVGQNILQLHTGGAPNIISKTRCYPPLPRIIPMLPLNADSATIEKFWKTF